MYVSRRKYSGKVIPLSYPHPTWSTHTNKMRKSLPRDKKRMQSRYRELRYYGNGDGAFVLRISPKEFPCFTQPEFGKHGFAE